jgi:PAS domain S-box-containing protein
MAAMLIFDLDPTVTQESWAANWDRIKSDGARSIVSEGKTRDGRVFPIEVNAHFLEFEGTEFLCSFVRDISERKEKDIFEFVGDKPAHDDLTFIAFQIK